MIKIRSEELGRNSPPSPVPLYLEEQQRRKGQMTSSRGGLGLEVNDAISDLKKGYQGRMSHKRSRESSTIFSPCCSRERRGGEESNFGKVLMLRQRREESCPQLKFKPD